MCNGFNHVLCSESDIVVFLNSGFVFEGLSAARFHPGPRALAALTTSKEAGTNDSSSTVTDVSSTERRENNILFTFPGKLLNTSTPRNPSAIALALPLHI